MNQSRSTLTGQRSNIGIVGTDSIRVNGVLISELPMAERQNAASQIPIARDIERQNKIQAIYASYPKHRVSYVTSKINEARDNIKRISEMRAREERLIEDYERIINMCNVRDKELVLHPLNEDGTSTPERDECIRRWNQILTGAEKSTAAYIVYEDLTKFREQIQQCRESMARADEVIARENDDISMMERLNGQIISRDIELRRLGVYQKD